MDGGLPINDDYDEIELLRDLEAEREPVYQCRKCSYVQREDAYCQNCWGENLELID